MDETASPVALGAAADPMLPRLARVQRRRREAPQVWTLELENGGEQRGPGFEAGQFNMLGIPGIGEVPISLSGDPADPARLLHTIRAVGPVSTALTRLACGERVALRGPFGTGWPLLEAAGKDVIAVAGGLGLAPLRPALHALRAARARLGRVIVLYGARSPQEILFRRELESWQRGVDFEVEITVDHALGDWHGHVGVVTRLIERAKLDPARALALTCGPEVMMRFAIAALRHAGLGEEQIFLSMERNMQCAVGLCGHCQFGPLLLCRDGPVLRLDRLGGLIGRKEI